MTEDAIASRVEELLAAMTTAEKAGQLTQYFYFGFLRDATTEGTVEGAGASQPSGSRRLSRGARRARCCSSPTRPRRTGCNGWPSRATGTASRCCSGSTSSTAFARSSRCRSRWPRRGTRPRRAGPGRGRARGASVGIHWAFAPMVDIARDPRWGRMIEGAGEDPYLGAAVAVAQVRGFQGPRLGEPEHHRRPQALRGLRRCDRRTRLRRGEPVRLRAVERLLPAVRGGDRRRCGERHDGLHGPQRCPRHGQQVALHRLLRDTWGFEGFVVSDANAVRTC